MTIRAFLASTLALAALAAMAGCAPDTLPPQQGSENASRPATGGSAAQPVSHADTQTDASSEKGHRRSTSNHDGSQDEGQQSTPQ